MLQAMEARRSERLWRERNSAFTSALEQQKEDTLDITSDLVRQYKAMQEQTGRRMDELEMENEALRATVKDREAEIAKLQVG